MFMIFFFFKQKTAYEMRISDWSSDVCSSDLGFGAGLPFRKHGMIVPGQQGQGHGADESRFDALDRRVLGQRRYEEIELAARYLERKVGGGPDFRRYFDPHSIPNETLHRRRQRSEEHTLELQPIMRISYAV